MQIDESEIEIWRLFKSGKSAKTIAKSLDIGVGTVLRIVLLVESEMATSNFFRVELDAEGCPDPRSISVQIPSGDKDLEEWLRNAQ